MRHARTRRAADARTRRRDRDRSAACLRDKVLWMEAAARACLSRGSAPQPRRPRRFTSGLPFRIATRSPRRSMVAASDLAEDELVVIRADFFASSATSREMGGRERGGVSPPRARSVLDTAAAAVGSVPTEHEEGRLRRSRGARGARRTSGGARGESRTRPGGGERAGLGAGARGRSGGGGVTRT